MNSANQDITLWESFRKGDKEAFATLFREHYETLFRFGSKFTSDTELLEDCIQELFIELWQAKSATPVLSIKAYLLKSLKYKLLRAFSKKGKMIPLTNDGSDIAFEWSHEMVLISKQDSDEKKQRVLKAMGRLSNRQKEIIYLKYYQNLSYEEVSEIMNINYQVARNLLYQAIKSLKALLAGTMEIFLLFL
ncbi:MAG TPA: sigma-70 family RNA polymerase sigma factor [Puia sp.]|nr:sigma-70 family RNA polymerase sigma factor [Puia sp.]